MAPFWEVFGDLLGTFGGHFEVSGELLGRLGGQDALECPQELQNRLLEVSRTPPGAAQRHPQSSPGGLQETILELLGALEGILDALAAKKHSRHPKMTSKSAQKVPKYLPITYYLQ